MVRNQIIVHCADTDHHFVETFYSKRMTSNLWPWILVLKVQELKVNVEIIFDAEPVYS